MSFLSEEQKVEFRTVVGKLIHRAAGKMIAKADQDGDGKLSWDEIKVFASTEQDKADFEAADFNKDGKVDHEELSKFLTEKALDVTRDQTQGSSDEAVAYPYTLAIGTHSKNSIKQVLESMLSKLGL